MPTFTKAQTFTDYSGKRTHFKKLQHSVSALEVNSLGGLTTSRATGTGNERTMRANAHRQLSSLSGYGGFTTSRATSTGNEWTVRETAYRKSPRLNSYRMWDRGNDEAGESEFPEWSLADLIHSMDEEAQPGSPLTWLETQQQSSSPTWKAW